MLPSGRQRYARAVRGTQREALAAVRVLQSQNDAGVRVDQRRTVAGIRDWWVDNVLPGNVKASTVDDYRYVVGRYIKPHVGKVVLAKLTTQHVVTMLLTAAEAEAVIAAARGDRLEALAVVRCGSDSDLVKRWRCVGLASTSTPERSPSPAP